MRVVLDTNVLISALLTPGGFPDAIYRAWLRNAYVLVTCRDQIEELRDVLRRPALAERIRPRTAGELVNQLRKLSEVVGKLPRVRRSPDSNDDFLLALCEAGLADYLVTGDKSGLLALESHRRTRIITAREFARIVRR